MIAKQKGLESATSGLKHLEEYETAERDMFCRCQFFISVVV
jgi:hypothetical protein